MVELTRRLLPLSTRREDTYIAGISMGGYGALYNGLKYKETFGKIAAMSPAADIYRLFRELPDAGFPTGGSGFLMQRIVRRGERIGLSGH